MNVTVNAVGGIVVSVDAIGAVIESMNVIGAVVSGPHPSSSVMTISVAQMIGSERYLDLADMYSETM